MFSDRVYLNGYSSKRPGDLLELFLFRKCFLVLPTRVYFQTRLRNFVPNEYRILIFVFCFSISVMFVITCLEFWMSVSLIAAAGGTSMEQRFAIEPQDQTAIVGSRVTLPCRVINKLGALQWTRDDFALGTHRSLTEFFRYSMIGSDEEGKKKKKTPINIVVDSKITN